MRLLRLPIILLLLVKGPNLAHSYDYGQLLDWTTTTWYQTNVEEPQVKVPQKSKGPLLTMFPKNPPHPNLTEEDVGKPLLLTPLINQGKIQEAQDAAKVTKNFSNVESYSGFLTVDKKYDSNLFFWYFPSQFGHPKAPLVVWLQGGPGGSSLFGLFVEHGPWSVDQNLNLQDRSTAWSLPYNVLYVDQPAGTGFSYTKNDLGYARNQDDVARNMWEALKQFYTMFPELKQNQLYVTGESYAGKYVPAIGYKIHEENQNGHFHMPLAGVAIGDGLCDPEHQLDYGDFLYQVGLVDEIDRNRMYEYSDLAKLSIQNEQWSQATDEFDQLLGVYANSTGLNFYYNYLMSQQPPEFDNYPKLLQQAHVRRAIHVGNLTYDGISMTVHEHLNDDMAKSIKSWLVTLMENYKVMIYNGQLDVIIAFVQTENFINNLEWSGKYKYAMAPRKIWKVNGDVAGYVREYKNFRQVMVRDAGHILPYDQPKWAFDMIQRFIQGKPF